MNNKEKISLIKKLDIMTTLVPLAAIVLLCILFLTYPKASGAVLASIRSFIGNELGSYYLVVGLFTFICSLYMAFSRYGAIRLGDCEKPQYSNFKWGAMMFTAGLAADILF